MKKLLRTTAPKPGNPQWCKKDWSVRSSPSPASFHNLPRRQKALQARQRLQPVLDTSTEQNVPSSNDHKCQKLLTAASIVWLFRNQRHQVLVIVPSTMWELLSVIILSLKKNVLNMFPERNKIAEWQRRFEDVYWWLWCQPFSLACYRHQLVTLNVNNQC